MKNTIEVVAAVIKNENKYFCAKRNDYGELAKKWEFPGGKIETKETRQEALRREVLEELNIEVEIKDFIMTVKHEYKGFNLVLHAYICEVVKGNLKLSEHLEFRWATVEEMMSMDFSAADIPIIKRLKK